MFLVGFAAIGFSKFNLYQSAVGVAVGVAVLLLALLTFVPFFMAVLGHKLFWPSKSSAEHKENQFWGKAGEFVFKRYICCFISIGCVNNVRGNYRNIMWFTALRLCHVDTICAGDGQNIWRGKLVAFHFI